MDAETGFNGYQNYDTWLVSVFLSNVQWLYESARKMLFEEQAAYRADRLETWVRYWGIDQWMDKQIKGHTLNITVVNWDEIVEVMTEL